MGSKDVKKVKKQSNFMNIRLKVVVDCLLLKMFLYRNLSLNGLLAISL